MLDPATFKPKSVYRIYVAATPDRVVDRDVVHAHDAKYVLDAQRPQRLVDGLAAGQLSHRGPSVRIRRASIVAAV